MQEFYRKNSIDTLEHLPERGKVAWESPSNIALIKYWGKHGDQLPDNASLSLTLKKSLSRVDMEFQKKSGSDLSFEFSFEGQKNKAFEERISHYLNKVKLYFPFLQGLNLSIQSRNTFPHSAGIASSASFMSAMALVLCSLEKFGHSNYGVDFFRKASFMARLGSGSASRSVYSKMAGWGEHPRLPESTDEYAISMEEFMPPDLKNLRDAVIIVDSGPKKVSSSQGHKLMNGHFFAQNRIQQASANFARLMDALVSDNWSVIAEVIENEALSLHAMMLSSIPGYTLLKQQTLDIIEEIRDFRTQNNVSMAFTLDAGPNIHLLYKEIDKKQVEMFIQQKLTPLAEDQRIIYDEMGSGPELKELKAYE